MPAERLRILNGAFDPLTLEETVESVVQTIASGQRGYLCTVNVAILMMMRSDPRLQRFVDRARWIVADGQPLIWASRLGLQRLPERVAGVELIDELCGRAVREGLGVYLLGASQATVEATAHALRAKHRGLDLRGHADGYFDATQADERARKVAESGAQLLFVAMGVPRQEYFIEQQWAHLGASVAIGVGGSFEVIAGLKRRAPKLLQRTGLEWAFRFAQEPRRLGPRYLKTNSQFVGLLAREIVTGRMRDDGAAGG